MCAISGLLVLHGKPDIGVLNKISATMSQRGPDSRSIRNFGSCALAHERLSIVDVAGGTQPLVSENGDIAVIVNGEIYNHLELRRELIARGHRFATGSDSEVFVHGYEEYGTALFSRLHGMFAAAIWDQRSKSLLLVRDALGKKPLAYSWIDERTLMFASSLNAFHAHPGFDASLRTAGIAEYLGYRCITDPGSVYERVHKVPAGEWLRVSADGRVSRGVHWQFPATDDPAAYDRKREPELCEELRSIVRTAVERRFMSDVPVGVLLSGGIDSAIVAYEASRIHPDLPTFSLGFSGSRDELGAARATAKALGTQHHEWRIEADPHAAIADSEGAYDEPFADSSSVASVRICQLAKRHVGVVLNGDGGDEAFAGYPRLRLFAELAERSLSPMEVLQAGFQSHLPVARIRKPAKELLWANEIFNRPVSTKARWYAARWIFSPDEIGAMSGLDAQPADFDAHYDFSDAERSDYREYLCSDLLVKMDRASMYSGLEARSPLLDTHLISFSRQLGAGWKARDGVGKYLLRAAYKDRLPEHVWQLPKRGFASPTRRWLSSSLRDEVAVLAKDRLQPLYRYLDYAQVSRVTKNFSGPHKQVWTLLTLNRWLAREAVRRRDSPKLVSSSDVCDELALEHV